uniref:Uncharacterized protein n=1 Tax=Poecilia latipinna TaxID=48699 RepID=A0A3B3V9L6_9TELE
MFRVFCLFGWNMATILILCSALTSALCCDWLTHYNDLRNSTLVRVSQSESCSSHLSLCFQENFQLRFIRDSLVQIYNLYRRGNTSTAGWDAWKTTDFLESINRQFMELNECVSKKLKRYYRYLENNTLLHPVSTNTSPLKYKYFRDVQTC